MKKESFGIHWFRRDLRVAGNRALERNWKIHGGRVLGLFCFDSAFLARSDFSHHRFAFFLKTLRSLKEELQKSGGDLLVVDRLPHQVFPELIGHLRSRGQDVGLITWNRDYEPFARDRDARIVEILRAESVPVRTFRDHLVIEPDELFKTEPGDFYQVYSPFAKKWYSLFEQSEYQKRIASQEAGFRYLKSSNPTLFSLTWADVASANFPFKDGLEDFERVNRQKVTISIPEAGSREAFEQLQKFSRKIRNYKTDRDFPFMEGTSRFSLFLKNGSLTTSQIIFFLNLAHVGFRSEDGPARFLKELVWREFYYHILFHRPDVEKQAFLAKYKDLDWQNNPEWFKRWCDGTTGFPIVDAGMRELNSTGWMHNRVRMIVASFLCKDLLIDWRWGENYFMKMLLDGDMAPNNGGWQWAASTGCDPQPYFRVFNPWLQSAKFDPEGHYIRAYVPELKDVPIGNLHDEEAPRGSSYPRPMVVHAHQKMKAIAMYKVNPSSSR